MSLRRVAVLGGGLIGGSLARRVAQVGLEVTVVDPDEATRAGAAETGLLVRAAPGAWLVDVDLVVLAAPLDALPGLLAQVAGVGGGATVIDVGSVKAPVLDAAGAAGLGERFVGCHPMSGTERSGFAASSADLLCEVTWAVTPGESAQRTAEVVSWVAEVFTAQVLLVRAAEHDRAAALVSHVPHVLANALLGAVEAADAGVARHLAAGSFRDLTRVAGRNPVRTRNMLADNAAALGAVLDELAVRVAGYRALLAESDDARLLQRLEQVAVDAATVREPSLTWAPCPDLAARLPDGVPLLVRAGASGLECAEPV